MTNDFPSTHALPTYSDLADFRIWDLHFHGFGEEFEEVLLYARRMRIERLFTLDVAGHGVEPVSQAEYDRQADKLKKYQDLVYGIIRIDPALVDKTLAQMDRWIDDGPAVGIKYTGLYRRDEGPKYTCAHPNNDPIIRRAAELDAVIYIHTWIKVGGDPRYPGGGNNPGESTPTDVAELAARHPDVQMVCGHAGGDWELAVRAVRPHENVLFEFSGGDPWSGAVDFAVDWLGADRIVWGGHLESRCYANEISKVLDADLTDEQRLKVFGANLRDYAGPILREKGYAFDA